MKKYQFKDSGIEWLGEIPEHWGVDKFSYCVHFQEGPGILGKDFREKGIPLVRISGVKTHEVTLEGCNYLDPKLVEKKWNHFRLKKEDVVISCSASTGLVSEVTNDEVVGAIPYTGLIRLSPAYNKVTKNYLKTFIASDIYSNQIDLQKKGTTIEHYGPTHLNKMFIIRPPLPEQKAIAAYLDRATAKIDRMIAIKEAQLEKMEGYLESSINQIANFGLNNKNKILPESWKIVRLKSLGTNGLVNGIFKKKNEFGSGIKLVNVTDLYCEHNIIDYENLERVNCKADEIKRYSAKEGDLFFVRSSLKLEGIGVSALLEKTFEKNTVFECHIIRFRPNSKKVNPKYLKYVLNSKYIQSQFISLSKTVTMTTIAQNSIGSIKIPFPSKIEQDSLVIHLDKLVENSTKIKDLLKTQIATLHRYRKSMIHECVTGKKQVAEVM